MKQSIVVLYGGRSGEHEVSLVSAASVTRNLDGAAYDVVLIGIARDGSWYLQDEAELARCRAGAPELAIASGEERRVAVLPGGGVAGALVLSDGRRVRADAVFPVLHGTYGEDGTLQGLLEMAGLPYVGAGVLGSAVGMDKDKAKALWLREGLPVVPYQTVRAADWERASDRPALRRRAEEEFGYPLFVKPACAGSSVGASKAADAAGFERAVGEALEWDDKVIVEPFVRAQEVECSVTGNEQPVAYTPGEVAPTHEFYDYDAKYLDPDGAALLIPAKVDQKTLDLVMDLAVKAYRAAELSGLARVDFFVRKEDGAVFLNEVNTMPGFTTISMFPKMCEASGLPYGKLLDLLVRLARERWEKRSRRDYCRVPAAAEAL